MTLCLTPVTDTSVPPEGQPKFRARPAAGQRPAIVHGWQCCFSFVPCQSFLTSMHWAECRQFTAPTSDERQSPACTVSPWYGYFCMKRPYIRPRSVFCAHTFTHPYGQGTTRCNNHVSPCFLHHLCLPSPVRRSFCALFSLYNRHCACNNVLDTPRKEAAATRCKEAANAPAYSCVTLPK